MEFESSIVDSPNGIVKYVVGEFTGAAGEMLQENDLALESAIVELQQAPGGVPSAVLPHKLTDDTDAFADLVLGDPRESTLSNMTSNTYYAGSRCGIMCRTINGNSHTDIAIPNDDQYVRPTYMTIQALMLTDSSVALQLTRLVASRYSFQIQDNVAHGTTTPQINFQILSGNLRISNNGNYPVALRIDWLTMTCAWSYGNSSFTSSNENPTNPQLPSNFSSFHSP